MKLQPNFSWQKYEGKEENQKQQFQYQLQQQHIQVSNTTNATIDDASYWTRERMTAFTWVDGKAIWTKTLTTTLTVAANNPVPHGITGIDRVVGLHGVTQDAVPLATLGLPLPYVDVTAADPIVLSVDPTNINITLVVGSAWVGYVAQVTIEFTKV